MTSANCSFTRRYAWDGVVVLSRAPRMGYYTLQSLKRPFMGVQYGDDKGRIAHPALSGQETHSRTRSFHFGDPVLEHSELIMEGTDP